MKPGDITAELTSQRPAFDDNSIFLDERWLTATRANGGRNLDWLVASDDAGVAAAMPVFHYKRYGLKLATNPLHAAYAPLWIRPGGKRGREQQLLHTASSAFSTILQRRFHKINLAIGLDVTDMRGFTWAGMRSRPQYTYIIHLHQPQCKHKSKYEALRKSKKRKPELREEVDPALILRLEHEMFARQQMTPPMESANTKPWIEQLIASGLGRQFTAYVDGEAVSSHVWLFNPARKHVFAWLGANNPDWLTEGMATWTLWAIFSQLREEGYDTVDLCGANIPHLNAFYETLDAELRLNFRIVQSAPGLLRFLPGGRI